MIFCVLIMACGESKKEDNTLYLPESNGNLNSISVVKTPVPEPNSMMFLAFEKSILSHILFTKKRELGATAPTCFLSSKKVLMNFAPCPFLLTCYN